MRGVMKNTSLAMIVFLAACTPAEPSSTPTTSTSNPAPTATTSTTTASTATAITTASAAPAASASAAPPEKSAKTVPDIEYVPTPTNVVEKMLEVAKLSKDDVMYDLGCGDGRIIITAAKKFGLKARGYDIDPVRVEESRANAKKAGVENLVTIEQKDIFEVDLSPATVVTLYLLPELNVRLIPQLEKLKPGSRIISHDFDMAGVEPEKWWTIMAPDHRDAKKLREHYVYLWKTPLNKTAAKK
jgi:SAM-dependent methyltransferase